MLGEMTIPLDDVRYSVLFFTCREKRSDRVWRLELTEADNRHPGGIFSSVPCCACYGRLW